MFSLLMAFTVLVGRDRDIDSLGHREIYKLSLSANEGLQMAFPPWSIFHLRSPFFFLHVYNSFI